MDDQQLNDEQKAQLHLNDSRRVLQGAPRVINWLENPIIRPFVKTQGNFQTCSPCTISTTLEYGWKIEHPDENQVQFAEQQLINCVPPKVNEDGVETWRFTEIMEWVKHNGIALRSEFPYKGAIGGCLRTKSNDKYGATDYKFLHNYDQDELIRELAKHPVAVAVDMCKSFSDYKGPPGDDIYRGPLADEKLLGDHAVTLMGCGLDTDTEEEVFIVQSSFGSEWGIGGFAKVQRDVIVKERNLLELSWKSNLRLVLA